MRLIASLIFVFLLATASRATAATPAPTTPVAIATDRIDTMLRTGHADKSWFSDVFLSQVPVSKVDDIVASLTSTLGAYQSVEFTPDKFIAHFAKGTDEVLIHLDADYKIDGLFFRPPVTASSQ